MKRILLPLLTITLSVLAQKLSISGGENFSIAVTGRNELLLWGANNFGQLGTDGGKEPFRLAPTAVIYANDLNDPIEFNINGKFPPIIQASAQNSTHVAAVDCNHFVWCWGNNDHEQLGRNYFGNTVPQISFLPSRVFGGEQKSRSIYLSDIISVKTGANSTYALDVNGNVFAWGDNTYGQLGNGGKTNSGSPVYVRTNADNILTNIIAIEANNYSAYALDDQGIVWSWGFGEKSELGRPTTNTTYASPVIANAAHADNSKPYTGSNKLNKIIKIAAGGSHCLALASDGKVWSWGDDTYGQLGQGNGTQLNYNAGLVVEIGNTSTSAPFLGSNDIAINISAGQTSSAIVLKSNNVISFGANGLLPATTINTASGIFNCSSTKPYLSAGTLSQGKANGTSCELIPVSEISQFPIYVNTSSGKLSNIVEISAGAANYFAKTVDDKITGWGWNRNGELNTGDYKDLELATDLSKFSIELPPICPIKPKLGVDQIVCNSNVNYTINSQVAATFNHQWYYNTSIGDPLSKWSPVGTNSSSYTATKTGFYICEISENNPNGVCQFCNNKYDTLYIAPSLGSYTPAPKEGLIDFYGFNGNLTDLINTSNSNTPRNNALFQGGTPTYGANRFGVANSALVLNGTTNYVTQTSPSVTPSDFSIAIWFNTQSAQGRLIGFSTDPTNPSKDTDRHLYINSLGQLVFGYETQSINTTTAVNDNLWHHAVATYSRNSGLKLYLDGNLQAVYPFTIYSTIFTPIGGYWKIGYDNLNAWPSSGTNYFYKGLVDDAAIYYRELTLTEIQSKFGEPIRVNNVLCSNTISINAPTFAGTYSWTGPAGTTITNSTTANPSIAAFNLINSGIYTLNVTGTCPVKATVEINSNTRPGTLPFVPTSYFNFNSSSANSGIDSKDVCVLVNNPVYKSDMFGTPKGSILLNGIDQYLTNTNVLTTAPVYTIGLAFKTTTKNGGLLVARTETNTTGSNPSPIMLFMSQNGYVNFGHVNYSSVISSNKALNDGNWHFAVATWDGSIQSLYIDGTLQSTLTNTTTYLANTILNIGGNTYIYYANNPVDIAFKGSIDEVFFDSRVYSVAQINSYYKPLINSTPKTICNGNTVSLNSNYTGTSYNWNGPNTFTSTLANSTIASFKNINNGNYTLKVSVANGCNFNDTSIIQKSILPVKVTIPNTYCGYMMGTNFEIRISNPQNNVSYRVSSSHITSQTSYQPADSVLILQCVINPNAPVRGSFTVIAEDISKSCSETLAYKFVDIYLYPALISNLVSVSAPTCTSDSKIVVDKTYNGYTYTPVLNYIPLTKYQIIGDTLITNPTFNINKYDFGAPVNDFRIQISNTTGCISNNSIDLINLPNGGTRNFNIVDDGKISAPDSIALLNFVKRTGYAPTATNYSWYNRTIASNNTTKLPIRDWNYGGTKLIQSACGKITEINFNGYSDPMGTNRPFVLAFDTLTELRILDISNNYFIGKFDSPRAITTNSILNLDITNNQFIDESFINFAGKLNNTQVYCRNNFLSYISLLKIPLKDYNNDINKIFPQNQFTFNDTTTFKGANFVYKNIIPDSKDGLMSYAWINFDTGDTISRTRDLIIPNIQLKDSGNYYCEVSHSKFPSPTNQGLKVAANTNGFIPKTTSIYATSLSIKVLPCANETLSAGNDVSACTNSPNINLNGSFSNISGLTPTYLWTGNGGNFSPSKNILNPTYTPSTSEINAGKTTLTLTVTTDNGNCVYSDNVIVTYNPTPTFTTTTPVTICGTGSRILTATNTGFADNFYWYTQLTGGSSIGSGNTYTTPTVSTTTTFFVEAKSNLGCLTTPRTPITVTVNPIPTVAAVANQTVCNGLTQPIITFSGTPAGVSFNWEHINTTIGITSSTGSGNITAFTALNSSSAAIVDSFKVYPVANACSGPFKGFTITVNPSTKISTQPSVTAATYCQGAATAALTVSATGVGLAYQWFSNTTSSTIGGTAIAGATLSNYSPASTTIGTTYYYCIVSGTCGNVTSNVSGAITINAITKINSENLPAAQYCVGATATAINITATGTNVTYQWYRNTTASNLGGTAITSANTNIYTPPTTTVGTSYFYCVVSSTTCGVVTSSVSGAIVVNSTPTISSLPSYTICSGNSVLLKGNGTPIGGYFWYTKPSGGTPMVDLTNTPILTANTNYYLIDSSAVTGCKSTRQPVTITVNKIPTAPSVTNVAYCQGMTATILQANTTNGSTGPVFNWYNVATGGTASSTAPTPSTSVAGITTYYVAEAINNCESPRIGLTVTVNAIPNAPQTFPVSYCQNATASPLTATGTGINFRWYGTNQSGGTASTIAPTPTTSINGVTTYYVSEIVNGCESPRASITVTVASSLAPPNTSPLSLCQGSTAAPLTANAAGTLNWYGTNQTGGTASTSAPTPNTTTLGTITYYVSQVQGTCESPRASIVVTVSSPPTLVITNPNPICSYDSTDITLASITAGSSAGLSLTYWTNAAATLPYTKPQKTTAGTYYVQGTNSAGCSVTRPIVVSANPAPVVTITNPTPQCVPNTVDLTSNTITTGSTSGLTFTYWTNSSATTSYNTPTTATSGTYYIKGTTSAGCFAVSSVLVTINPMPSIALGTIPNICYGTPNTILPFTAVSNNPNQYSIDWSATANAAGLSDISNVALPVSPILIGGISSVISGNYSGNLTVKNVTTGCVSVGQIVSFTINVTPSVIITQPTAVCAPNTVDITNSNLVAGSDVGLNYTYWANSSATTSLTNASGITSGGTYFIKGTSSLGCSNTQPIFVKINNSPSAPTPTPINDICSGNSTLLTQQGNGSYFWYVTPTGGTPLANNNPTPVLNTTTTYYLIDSTIATGCSSNRVPVTINVNKKPFDPVVQLMSPICEGTSASLSYYNGNATGAFYWYSDLVGGTPISNFTNSPILTAKTTYYIIDSSSVTGCKSNRIPIEFPVTPKLTPTINVIPSQTSICTGATVTFTTSVTNEGVSPTYVWKINGNIQPNETLSKFISSSLIVGDIVSVELTSSETCVSTNIAGDIAPAMSNSNTLIADVLIDLDKPNACMNDLLTFTATPINGGTNPSYEWFINGISAGTTNNSSIYSSNILVTDDVVSVKMTSNASCLAISEATVLADPLTLVNTVTPNIIVTPNTLSTCYGTEVIFKTTILNGGPNPNYEWRINGQPVSIGFDSLTVNTLQNGDTVTVTLISDAMCTVTPFAVDTADVVTITSLVNPNISVSPDITTICEGAPVTYTTTSSNEGSNPRYVWKINGDTLSNETSSTFTTTKLRNGDIVAVKLFSDANCLSVDSAEAFDNSVIVIPSPFLELGNTTSICDLTTEIPLVPQSSSSLIDWNFATNMAGNLQFSNSPSNMYSVNPNDLQLDTLTFYASVPASNGCNAVNDSVKYVFTPSVLEPIESSTTPLNQNDYIQMSSFLENISNLPTSFDTNIPTTWIGTKTACGYVAEIRMPNLNMMGPLVAIDKLPKLNVLDLSNNGFMGTLDFSPDTVFNRMRVVNLANNQIEFDKGIDLNYYSTNTFDTLWLQNNKSNYIYIMGNAPADINISKMDINQLFINNNKYSSLKYLNASENNLNSDFASAINFGSDSLRYLNLSRNQLTGKFSINDTSLIKNMEHIDVSHNQLSTVSSNTNLGLCTQLKHIDLGNNQISNGNFIDDLSGLKALTYFAIDSNSTNNFDEVNSGFRSLPILPNNAGLILNVRNNHLDFNDLEPYAKWFNKNQALYIPQFDTIDTQELLKPVTGDDVILSTSLYTPNNVYQWQKLNPTTNSFENISGNAAQKVDYVFVFNGSASEGNYTTVVTNTLLPGLSYTRRPIVLETCGSVFDASYKIFNDLAACYGKDTLVVDVTDKSTNTNVSVNVKHWYFDNHLLNNIYDLKLPIEISGTYKYAVLDNLTKCLIQSKNIAAVTNYNYKPTISFDAQNDSSLVVNNVDTSTLAYQWYINELPIASATGNSLRIYFNGNYHVDAISKRNCVSSSSKEKVIAFTRDFIRAEHQTNANGQILLNTSQSVDIYPNPASDVFKFVNINAGSTVTIADMNGQELLSMVVTDVNSGIETNNLPAGMYQVKISFGESITYRKLVIKK